MLLDTNVLVRHLTGQPAAQADRATAFLEAADNLFMADLVVAELVYVLESVYKRPAPEVAALIRAVVAFRTIKTADEAKLLRAIELYEVYRVHFAEAYLAASAELGDGRVASFDQGLDRVGTIRRIEP